MPSNSLARSRFRLLSQVSKMASQERFELPTSVFVAPRSDPAELLADGRADWARTSMWRFRRALGIHYRTARFLSKRLVGLIGLEPMTPKVSASCAHQLRHSPIGQLSSDQEATAMSSPFLACNGSDSSVAFRRNSACVKFGRVVTGT